jgi:hypothetical protein
MKQQENCKANQHETGPSASTLTIMTTPAASAAAAKIMGAAAAAASSGRRRMTDAATATATAVQWLDVRGAGLSMLERLCLEECLLHHDDRHWIICGTHEAGPHKYLQQQSNGAVGGRCANHMDDDGGADTNNNAAAIVLGLSGKPNELLNMEIVRRDPIMTIKRFSGGGTVVLDYNSIWVSIIGRPPLPQDSPFVDNGAIAVSPFAGLTEIYPRPIMEWTVNVLYAPLFQRLDERNHRLASAATKNISTKNQGGRQQQRATLILDTKSCGAADNSGRTVSMPFVPVATASTPAESLPPPPANTSSSFRLHQNDYVFGNRKIGGNAQAIVKNGWIHHTSFLWDYHPDNMRYLQLPHKRPVYRGDRPHDDFLMRLSTTYPYLRPLDFIECLKEVAVASFADRGGVETTTTRTALATFQRVGGLNEFFATKSRNKVLDPL